MSAPEDKVHESPIVSGSETFISDFAKCHVNGQIQTLIIWVTPSVDLTKNNEYKVS
ncbi:MAG: hypothetical protein RPT13_00635 [SAR324 cluster bacterium]|jgi:hypothetical protein